MIAQVAPSFFDAPGIKAASSVSAFKPKQAGTLSTSPSRSAASVRRFTQDQPELAFAYVSEFGYKVSCLASRSHGAVGQDPYLDSWTAQRLEGCTNLQQLQIESLGFLWLQTGTASAGTVVSLLHVCSADSSCI